MHGRMLVVTEAVRVGEEMGNCCTHLSFLSVNLKHPCKIVFGTKKKRRGEGTLLQGGGARESCAAALQPPLMPTMCGVLGGQASHFITLCLRKCLPAPHLPF